jgi:hypothetical protein
VASSEELGEDARQKLEFTGGTDELVIDETAGVDLILHTVEQERVLADLSKLHELVTQPFHASRFPVQSPTLARLSIGKHVNTPFRVLSIRNHLELLHLTVQLRLQRAHPHFNHLLYFIWQFALDVLLQPPQEERSEHLVQPPDDEQRFFFVQLDLVSRPRICERRVEPLIKRLNRVEDLWEDKVEEGPELGKVILERCTGEDEAETGMIVLSKCLRQLALGILHTVTFIYMQQIQSAQSNTEQRIHTNNHVYPFDLAENWTILDNIFVGRQQDLELTRPQLRL